MERENWDSAGERNGKNDNSLKCIKSKRNINGEFARRQICLLVMKLFRAVLNTECLGFILLLDGS